MSGSRSRKDRSSKQGLLKADINAKTDELFIRWFNLPGTQKILKNGLREIRKPTVQKKPDNEIKPDKPSDTPPLLGNNEKPISQSQSPTPNNVKPVLSPRRKPTIKGKTQTKIQTNNSNLQSTIKIEERKSEKIPKFYFPGGEPKSKDETKVTLTKISKTFQKVGKERLTCPEMAPIAKACGYSEYWKSAIFKASLKGDDDTVSKSDVIAMWSKLSHSYHDNASRFVKMLAKPGNRFLEFDDFLTLLQDIVSCHPGLSFLREAPEFHTRYMNTVIARIFYVVNRSWSGQITVSELRKSNFLDTLDILQEEEDINAISDYFSYEHFYVVYCKFWELDTDHDLIIDKLDLTRHANGALSSRLIDRVLSGAVTRWDSSDHRSCKMSYVDFVWFLISEEDKKSSTSIEYWFRCMDLDGDGVISMYEMEYFYEEQMQKLEQLDIEPLPFQDCVCQMLDMVKPLSRNRVTLKDLKNCKMADVFFDTFFNVEKYLNHEQKDPFAPQKDVDSALQEPSDWEKFAAEEYELLVAEEQANEQASFDLHHDEEVDPLIEEELRNLGIGLGTAKQSVTSSRDDTSVSEQTFYLSDTKNPNLSN